MEFSEADINRMLLAEHTRKTSEDTYARNPLDAENPGNDLYQKSLEVAAKAPLLHMELQMAAAEQRTMGGGSSASSTANEVGR
ncbi:Plant specific mitochondrial import receptor subunit TOM20 [Corchorus olitorius]|uniref:Plant specific mitochondrial import receptor subunit TOM20 n=1 Tax=Corchorus olitorius TaxID=93759 RepID=A0A1R3J011_9ROSI|nr:Plant specific mitochondrial import receptor subunit TOM20 [Corchorus olitorius]